MIFSLSTEMHSIQLTPPNGTDVFCFFYYPNAVNIPADLWFASICASLKMRHEVLLLGPGIDTFPVWNSKLRWHTGENWSWLSPRSLGPISEAYRQNPMNFQEFKAFLTSSK